MDGDTATFQPFVAVRFGSPCRWRGLFDEIEALIQTIAADDAVVRRRPDAVNGIARPDHVLAPHRKWVNPQLAAQLSMADSMANAGWVAPYPGRPRRTVFV